MAKRSRSEATYACGVYSTVQYSQSVRKLKDSVGVLRTDRIAVGAGDRRVVHVVERFQALRRDLLVAVLECLQQRRDCATCLWAPRFGSVLESTKFVLRFRRFLRFLGVVAFRTGALDLGVKVERGSDELDMRRDVSGKMILFASRATALLSGTEDCRVVREVPEVQFLLSDRS